MALSNINGDIKFYINSEAATEKLKDGSIYKNPKIKIYCCKIFKLKKFYE